MERVQKVLEKEFIAVKTRFAEATSDVEVNLKKSYKDKKEY